MSILSIFSEKEISEAKQKIVNSWLNSQMNKDDFEEFLVKPFLTCYNAERIAVFILNLRLAKE